MDDYDFDSQYADELDALQDFERMYCNLYILTALFNMRDQKFFLSLMLKFLHINKVLISSLFE